MKYGTKITTDEAEEIISGGKGFVTGGGYTFYRGYYCAHGPIPGCFRGGPTTLNSSVKQWYKLNLKELVLTHGFYPDPFMLYSLIVIQCECRDYSVDLNDLVRYCIDSQYTKEQLLGPARSEIWENYFNEVGTRNAEFHSPTLELGNNNVKG